jgi:hypothetical protein
MWVKRAELKYVESSDGLNTASGVKLGEQRSAEGVVSGTKTSSVDGSVEGEDARTGEEVSVQTDGNDVQRQQPGSGLVQKDTRSKLSVQNKDKVHRSYAAVVICDGHKHGCTNNNASQGTSLHADLGSNARACSERLGARPVTSKSAVISTAQYARLGKEFEMRGLSNQRNIFSAKDSIFSPRTAVHQHRPENFGDNKIMSVSPGTKPGPQWCPAGLTHTQKRRVQRLRASEIKEEIAEKKCTKCFNRDGPMVPPKMIWKEKHITTDENRKTDDTVVAQNSENNIDAPTDMDVDQGG